MTAALAWETVRSSALALGEAGVPVMPLKGALFQRLIYERPEDRFLTDVDLLVPGPQVDSARRALTRAGCRHRTYSQSFVEQSYYAPTGMVIDLHWKLFGHGRYRMPTHDVFSRSRVDDGLFDAPVRVMDPYDIFAHLIGKLGSDHVVSGHRSRLREVVLVAKRLDLAAGRAADRLVHCGVARAARYALPLVAKLGEPFPTDVLHHLPRDPVGELVARGAAGLVEVGGRTSVSASLAGHLLNDSLPRAAGALGAAVLARGRFYHATFSR